MTIGVAIAVPEPWGAQLQSYRSSLGDESGDAIPTHITLVPPFDVPADEMAAVQTHLETATQTHRRFDVHLRGTGTFRPVSPVVFIALAEGISACEQLATSVRAGPLAAQLRFPYHPHVTVAHDLDDDVLSKAFDEMSSFECRFTVTRFSLFFHDPAAGWVPARDFELAG